MNFNIGETVICSMNVKNSSGADTNPSTSMLIEIKQKSPNVQTAVASTAMTNDSTGNYHYDFASSAMAAGTYEIVYKAVDGARISISKETFGLE